MLKKFYFTGIVLATFRARKKFVQKEVAHWLGVEKGYISNLEQGYKQLSSQDDLTLLFKQLEIPERVYFRAQQLNRNAEFLRMAENLYTDLTAPIESHIRSVKEFLELIGREDQFTNLQRNGQMI